MILELGMILGLRRREQIICCLHILLKSSPSDEMCICPASRGMILACIRGASLYFTLGYVAGDLCFQSFDEDHGIDCTRLTSDGGAPIGSSWTRAASTPHSPGRDQTISVRSGARYLLLVEKEGVFRRLCQEQLHR